MAASKPIRPRPSREKIVSIIRDPVKKTPIKTAGNPAIIIKGEKNNYIFSPFSIFHL